ncbi:hypothetical protein PAMP_011276 [Pampus punctatissimus]
MALLFRSFIGASLHLRGGGGRERRGGEGRGARDVAGGTRPGRIQIIGPNQVQQLGEEKKELGDENERGSLWEWTPGLTSNLQENTA